MRRWSQLYPLAAVIGRPCGLGVTTNVFDAPLWVGSQRGLSIAIQTAFPTADVMVRIQSLWFATESNDGAPFIVAQDDYHFKQGSVRNTNIQWPIQADWLQIQVVNPTAAGTITVGITGSDRIDRLEFPGILNSPLAYIPLIAINTGLTAVAAFQQPVGTTEQQGPYSGRAYVQTASNGAGPWQVTVNATPAGGTSRSVLTWQGVDAPGALAFYMPPLIGQLFIVNLGANASFEATVWADRQ